MRAAAGWLALCTAAALCPSAFCESGLLTPATYVGRAYPAPDPAHLSTRFVPTPLDPNHLVNVDSGLRFATLQDTVLAARPGGAQLVTLQSAADVDSGAACNQLCLQHGGAGAAPAQNCTVWQYCGNATGGCPGGGGGQPGLAPRTCLLQSLPGAGAGFAQAPCTLADCRAAPANRSLLGAPIPVAYAQAPGLPGYARYPCIDAPARSDFPAGCPAAMNLTRYGLAANPGRACWVNGTLAGMAAACDATPECDFFVFYPLGRSPGAAQAGPPSGVLKTARRSTNASQLNTTEGDLLEPQGYDQRTSFNTLSASYFKFQALLEASEIRPSALNASQRIVVMEVKNLTCDPQQAGADLRTDLHEHLAPPPQRVRLNEAAASHSHALAPAVGAQGRSGAAEAYVPLPAALVVANMTFLSPEDASAADAVLNASLASLPSHGAHGRAVSLLYVTGPQELPISQPHSV